MSVLGLTVFLSLLLVVLFVVLYYVERARGGAGNAEREALKPLDDEQTRPAGGTEQENEQKHSSNSGKNR